MEIESKVLEIVKEPVEKLGLVVDEVLYVKEGSQYFLRIVIDKPGYVDLDDCVNASNIINPLLDNSNIEIDNYILDVCSKQKGCE